jgi:hypothetical protein
LLRSQIDDLSAEVKTRKTNQARAWELQHLRDEPLAKVDEQEKSF